MIAYVLVCHLVIWYSVFKMAGSKPLFQMCLMISENTSVSIITSCAALRGSWKQEWSCDNLLFTDRPK